eukprot:169084_1
MSSILGKRSFKQIAETDETTAAPFRQLCCKKTDPSLPMVGCCHKDENDMMCDTWKHWMHLEPQTIRLYCYLGSQFVWNCIDHETGREHQHNLEKYQREYGHPFEYETEYGQYPVQRRKQIVDICSESDSEQYDEILISTTTTNSAKPVEPQTAQTATTTTTNSTKTDNNTMATLEEKESEPEPGYVDLSAISVDKQQEIYSRLVSNNMNAAAPNVFNENASNHSYFAAQKDNPIVDISGSSAEQTFGVRKWRAYPHIHAVGTDDNGFYLVQMKRKSDYQQGRLLRITHSWSHITNHTKKEIMNYFRTRNIDLAVFKALKVHRTVTLQEIKSSYQTARIVNDVASNTPANTRDRDSSRSVDRGAVGMFDSIKDKAMFDNTNLTPDQRNVLQMTFDTNVGSTQISNVTATNTILSYANNPFKLQSVIESYQTQSWRRILCLGGSNNYNWAKTVQRDDMALLLLVIAIQIVVMKSNELQINLSLGMGPTFFGRVAELFNIIVYQESLNAAIWMTDASTCKAGWKLLDKYTVGDKNAEFNIQFVKLQRLLIDKKAVAPKKPLEDAHDGFERMSIDATTKALHKFKNKTKKQSKEDGMVDTINSLCGVALLGYLSDQQKDKKHTAADTEKKQPIAAVDEKYGDMLFDIVMDLTIQNRQEEARIIERVMSEQELHCYYVLILRRLQRMDERNVAKDIIVSKIIELCRNYAK